MMKCCLWPYRIQFYRISFPGLILLRITRDDGQQVACLFVTKAVPDTLGPVPMINQLNNPFLYLNGLLFPNKPKPKHEKNMLFNLLISFYFSMRLLPIP